MTENYRLRSIALESRFEEDTAALTLPAVIESAHDAGLAILEGAYRPPNLACRFVQPTGLLGLRLPDGPLPEVLRVLVLMRSGQQADERWETRATRIREARLLRGIVKPEDPADLDVAGRHRFIAVHVQGKLRSQALFSHDSAQDSRVRQRLVLDVPSSAIDASRLLLISFGPAHEASAQALPDPLVGVTIPRIRIQDEDELRHGTVSTGGPARQGWSPYLPTIGFAVVNPNLDGSEVIVEVEHRRSSPGGRVLRRLLGGSAPDPRVEVVDAAGAAVTVEGVVRRSRNSWTIRLPGDAGPLRMRLTHDQGDPRGAELFLRTAPAAG